ncbi:hypothetical protein [Parahaliea mediterranea]|uniref:DUF4412 domain-containing protein n=1 Tax=Parahaliea mediterranea TaxID=651086 RepID=A0A939DHW3_9GAMM|nr:hypothetical protein [Parahaliea mediterranea]MBN7798415.1 hypothetical protein [Parahaliea mediterranea]
MRKSLASLTATIALAGIHHSASYADIAEVETEDGEVITFEYEGDLLRINPTGNEQGYMLMRDGKMYVVTQNDGQPMVLDMSSAFKMFGAMAGSTAPSTVESQVLSLQATGKSETLGGIQGEVYALRYIDHNGKEQSADMVLSKDPLARGFRDAIQSMAVNMAKSLDKDSFKDELEAGEQMQAKLQDLNMGVLRYGSDMRIRSIEDTNVAAERFALPAEPTDLGSMLSEAFGGGQGGESGDDNSTGGILGSIFGGGQNQDQGQDQGDDGEQGQKSAAEAVGEAFGKLFGN